MHKLEFRRQILHVLYGFVLLFLYYYNYLDNQILLGMIIGGALTSLMVKRERLSGVRRFLSLFERDHHLEKFPGRGVLFFTIGTYLTLVLFERNIAFAGIMILSVGDAVSNIVGRYWGRIKTKLNPKKNIEGSVAGILVSLPLAYYFFPNIYAVLAASKVGMFLEIPAILIFNFEIDDNLLIPLGAAFTLTLFA